MGEKWEPTILSLLHEMWSPVAGNQVENWRFVKEIIEIAYACGVCRKIPAVSVSLFEKCQKFSAKSKFDKGFLPHFLRKGKGSRDIFPKGPFPSDFIRSLVNVEQERRW